MARRESQVKSGGTHGDTPSSTARSVRVARRGIQTDEDAAEFISALITDTMTEAVPERRANSVNGQVRTLIHLANTRDKLTGLDGPPIHFGRQQPSEPVSPSELATQQEAERQRQAKERRRKELQAELAALDGEGG